MRALYFTSLVLAGGSLGGLSAAAARHSRKIDVDRGNLPGMIAKTARGPSQEELRQRARRLDDAGLYFSALHDRIALLSSGPINAGDLQSAGESSLALNRLEPIVSAAADLERRGVGPGSWPAAFRAALAAYEYRQGRIGRAADYMPDSSQLERIGNQAARTRAVMVAAAIKAGQEQLAEAINVLASVVDNGAPSDSSLARLQRARLFYELGRYTETLEELAHVQKSSPHWYDGVHVSAWAAYKLRDDNLTLGQTMSLNSPHLAAKFNPESYIVEAASLYRLCHYESAERALKRMRAKYEKLPGAIARFRSQMGERFTGVATLLKFVHGKTGNPGGFSDTDWSLLVDGLVSQQSISDADRMLAQVQAESDEMNHLVPQAENNKWLFKVKSDYRAELEAAKREAYTVALRAMRRRLGEMEQDIASNIEGALAIEVEINTRIRERLISGATPRMKDVDFEAEVKKGYEFWPFEGEYWRDETGGYAFATTDVCVGQNAAGAR